jgi:hypothetical protein
MVKLALPNPASGTLAQAGGRPITSATTMAQNVLRKANFTVQNVANPRTEATSIGQEKGPLAV